MRQLSLGNPGWNIRRNCSCSTPVLRMPPRHQQHQQRSCVALVRCACGTSRTTIGCNSAFEHQQLCSCAGSGAACACRSQHCLVVGAGTLLTAVVGKLLDPTFTTLGRHTAVCQRDLLCMVERWLMIGHVCTAAAATVVAGARQQAHWHAVFPAFQHCLTTNP